MDQIAINTSQNVNIIFTLANVGERILAFVIDCVIKIVYSLCVYYVFFEIFDLESYLDTLDDWSVGGIIIMLTLPINLYTLVSESLMQGQTLGKKIVKIRVIKIDGYQASFADYLIRWVFRLVDISLFGIIGLFSMIFSKNNQRLGGIASGTAVISLKNNVKISHTILEEIGYDYVPMFPQVIALSDNDIRIIKDNYQRANTVNDRKIMSQLAQKIKEIAKIDDQYLDMTDAKFINIVIKDYNYYTGKEN